MASLVEGEQANKNNNLFIIDLTNPDIHHTVSLVKHACEEVGFFYVINHGVSQQLIDDLFLQSRKFFALPMEEKMKSKFNNETGFTAPFLDSLDPEKSSTGDSKEGYYLTLGVEEEASLAKKSLFTPVVWPSSEVLPGWKQTMEKYQHEALDVGRRVARLIALALNLDASFFDKPEILGEPTVIMRLLHYLDKVSNPELGFFGAGEHCDYGLLTLLLTDEVSGLQVCRDKYIRSEKWEDVKPYKGAFIVNIGDMIERWTNGIFRSSMHRVLLSGKERYSVAFFLEPNKDCIVECFPFCQSEGNPPKFSPVKYGEYLKQKYIYTKLIN